MLFRSGLSFYTLGQRQGLGIGGVKSGKNASLHLPWYVARKDMASNTLWVVQGRQHPWLQYQSLDADDTSWVGGEPPAAGRFAAKARYRQADAACALSYAEAPDARSFQLTFAQAQWAVTPGQSAVLYDGQVCLGGGIIKVAANCTGPIPGPGAGAPRQAGTATHPARDHAS